jgi:phospholipase C
MELLHGDDVVQTGQILAPQLTSALGDSTWRLRLHLAPNTPDIPDNLTYPFTIKVTYTSVLPVLTRRIPLDAFQQGFDKNWNGHDYVHASIEDNKLTIGFDSALASYYYLKDQISDLSPPLDTTLDNAQTGPIHLSAGASESPFSWVSGRFPYIQVDVPIRRTDPNNPIVITISDLLGPVPSDTEIDLGDFTLTFRFYIMPGRANNVMFFFEWDQFGHFESIRSAVQAYLDPYVAKIGEYVKPWLLGADFDLIDLRHEPETTSADPFGGYIVMKYVGQEVPSSSPDLTANGPSPTPLPDPFLFPDSLYVPRGAADSMWKPPQATAVGINPQPLEHRTTPGSLANMDHIVVVMMENRSFDHMLGYLSLEGGRTDVDGLTRGSDGKIVQFNYFNGHYYYPQLITNTAAVTQSPSHGHLPTKAQMADGMKHFVSNYAKIVGDEVTTLQLVMGYYGANQLPAYDLLAREFLICDRWFCSHIGPTWPNRFVTLTGDLNRDTFGEPETDTPNYADLTPVEAPTLFDHLTDRGVSWHYFQSRFGALRAYTKYTFDTTNVTEFDNIVNGFNATVRNGRLANVTFIDPSFGDLPPGNDDAPPADLRDGQNFIASILHTLFSATNPFWARTMLIVCYDEHGGFYDHVDPPDSGIPLVGQATGKLGPRVPAFVVSSLTPGRTVLHEVFDHSSIAATILRRFCSPHPPHMSTRVSAARDLREAITLTHPRNLLQLFDPPVVLGTPLSALNRRLVRTELPDDDQSLMVALSLIIGGTG